MKPRGSDNACDVAFAKSKVRRSVVAEREAGSESIAHLRALFILADALHQKHLVRPTFCESCYRDGRPIPFHPDLSKPLSVEWLCRRCYAAVAAPRARRVSA